MQRAPSDKNPIEGDQSLYAGAIVLETTRPINDLESQVRISSGGDFRPTQAPGELFKAFTRQPRGEDDESVFEKAFALVKALGAPIVWALYVDFFIYVQSSDPYLAPAVLLNPLLDAIEAALAPSPATGVQNLGLPAMVQHAYIAGKVETDEGVLGDQAIAIVPVEILCV